MFIHHFVQQVFFSFVYSALDTIIACFSILTHTNTQFTPQQNTHQQNLRILHTQNSRNLINLADPFFHNTLACTIIYQKEVTDLDSSNIGPLIVIASFEDLIRGPQDPLMPRDTQLEVAGRGGTHPREALCHGREAISSSCRAPED